MKKYKPIRTRSKTPAYLAIVTACNAAKLPTYYRSDVTYHDRLMVTGKDAPTRFLYILREAGSHLIAPLVGGNALKPDLAAFKLSHIKHITQLVNNQRFYVYENGKLTEKTADAMIARFEEWQHAETRKARTAYKEIAPLC
jgi:hypothetical protein